MIFPSQYRHLNIDTRSPAGLVKVRSIEINMKESSIKKKLSVETPITSAIQKYTAINKYPRCIKRKNLPMAP